MNRISLVLSLDCTEHVSDLLSGIKIESGRTFPEFIQPIFLHLKEDKQGRMQFCNYLKFLQKKNEDGSDVSSFSCINQKQ